MSFFNEARRSISHLVHLACSTSTTGTGLPFSETFPLPHNVSRKPFVPSSFPSESFGSTGLPPFLPSIRYNASRHNSVPSSFQSGNPASLNSSEDESESPPPRAPSSFQFDNIQAVSLNSSEDESKPPPPRAPPVTHHSCEALRDLPAQVEKGDKNRDSRLPCQVRKHA